MYADLWRIWKPAWVEGDHEGAIAWQEAGLVIIVRQWRVNTSAEFKANKGDRYNLLMYTSLGQP